MSTRSQDPLNQLLRKAMWEQKQRIAVQVLKPVQTKPTTPALGLYDDPRNWTQSRRIALIHRSPQGSETFLGVFIEVRNERAKVRRWLRDRSPQAHGSALPREVVSGPYWLQSQVCEPVVDTQEEIERIKARYYELMKEWEG